MTQPVAGVLQAPDLSSIPGIHVKQAGHGGVCMSPCAGEVEKGGSWDLVGS